MEIETRLDFLPLDISKFKKKKIPRIIINYTCKNRIEKFYPEFIRLFRKHISIISNQTSPLPFPSLPFSVPYFGKNFFRTPKLCSSLFLRPNFYNARWFCGWFWLAGLPVSSFLFSSRSPDPKLVLGIDTRIPRPPSIDSHVVRERRIEPVRSLVGRVRCVTTKLAI